jgi:uncharacterized 2Fe-2S/4Fe-4S cluster protein (DUF4445 family)
VYLPPNIAGYVGADHVSMLLGVGLPERMSKKAEETVLALDIGTNTEISLDHDGKIYSCSCASGPAFEGAHIQDGMRAAAGAIERVRMADGEVQLHTIAGQPPVGVCGSGVLDAVAELRRMELIDARGVMKGEHPRLRRGEKLPEFVLANSRESGNGRDIVITRKDVNEIQLAKGAIRAGVEVLLEEAGIAAEKIDHFLVAGAFGTYLDLNSAVKIGMFPDLPVERFEQVGNAAGTGAVQLLVSKRRRELASEIASRSRYIELTVHPKFVDIYMRALAFD